MRKPIDKLNLFEDFYIYKRDDADIIINISVAFDAIHEMEWKLNEAIDMLNELYDNKK